MIKYVVSLLLAASISSISALGQSTCGNDGPNNPSCPGGGNSPADSSSSCPTCKSPDCQVGVNPIDPYRANLHRNVQDITTFGAAPIAFSRFYYSRTTDFNDPYWQLGYKQTWQYNWDYEMRQLSTKTYGYFDIKVRYPDGNDYNFHATDTSGTQLAPAADNGDRLYRWAGSIVGYTLISPTGREYDFKRYSSPKFALLEERDGQGLYWDCSYDSSWRLIQITNCFGRYLQVTYENGSDGVSRIASVVTSDGRTVTYNYSTWASTGHFVLSNVNYPGGESAAYTYVTADPSDSAARPLLQTASDPTYLGSGSQMKYVYNYNAVFDYGSGPYLVTGTILEEHNLLTNQLIVSLPYGGGPNPTIVNGDSGNPAFSYANGLEASQTDAAGRESDYTRDSDGYGYISSKTEVGSGAVTTYTRDYAGRILSQTDALSHTQSYTYNSKGFILTATDENGHEITFTRDTNSWLTRKDYPDGTYESWTYNIYGQPLTHLRRNGGTEQYTYYAIGDTGGIIGDLKTLTDPMGNVTTYLYTASGLIASIKDGRNNITAYTYN